MNSITFFAPLPDSGCAHSDSKYCSNLRRISAKCRPLSQASLRQRRGGVLRVASHEVLSPGGGRPRCGPDSHGAAADGRNRSSSRSAGGGPSASRPAKSIKNLKGDTPLRRRAGFETLLQRRAFGARGALPLWTPRRSMRRASDTDIRILVRGRVAKASVARWAGGLKTSRTFVPLRLRARSIVDSRERVSEAQL